MNRREFSKKSILIALGTLSKSIMPFTVFGQQKKERTIYKIINPSKGGLGKLELKNVFQGDYQNYVSPFFLFDEFGPMELPKGAPFRVDAHPHAGIIPTTYLLKGNAHHRDSMENDFEYKKGDFIQFTSGKGALHMEETGDGLFKNGGLFHGIQSWLNIPPHLKKSDPSASHIKEENMGFVQKENITIKVILGEVFGVKSQTKLLMPVIYWHISMNEYSQLELPIETSQNAFIYLLSGQLEVSSNQTINPSQAVLFERNGDYIKIKAKKTSEFLVLGGEVNNEPYATNGPFVLNTEQELAKAYLDFQQGKFGDIAKTNGIRR